jgi:threonine/homoserine/homoserine lactone efflux protein
MFEQDTLILFLLATFVLLITPGPAVIYIVARSVSQGALGERLNQAGRRRYGKYITGTVFTGLGVVTALARK